MNRFKRSRWVGVIAFAGAELCWFALWLLVQTAHSENLSAALTAAYGAHLTPVLLGISVSTPMLRTKDKRAWVHLFTVVAAADYLSLIFGLLVALFVPGWGWRALILAAIAFWCLVTWSLYRFVSDIAATRTSRPAEPVDAVIVLGCGLVGRRPGPMLVRRLLRALPLATPGKPFVVSGGQGEDEEVSEAEAMAGYLHAEHADTLNTQNLILLQEDRAVNTRENLRYSIDMLREQGHDVHNIAVVTSDFHVKRTEKTVAMVQKLLGTEKDGMVRMSVHGAHTPPVARPAAYIREFIAYTLWTLRELMP